MNQVEHAFCEAALLALRVRDAQHEYLIVLFEFFECCLSQVKVTYAQIGQVWGAILLFEALSGRQFLSKRKC
jgi:hypothetical protein